MPDDNVWLAQRRAEHDALTRLLDSHCEPTPAAPSKAPAASRHPTGPVPLTLDLARHRRTTP